MQIGSVVWEK